MAALCSDGVGDGLTQKGNNMGELLGATELSGSHSGNHIDISLSRLIELLFF
jgi:hypothetical protein